VRIVGARYDHFRRSSKSRTLLRMTSTLARCASEIESAGINREPGGCALCLCSSFRFGHQLSASAPRTPPIKCDPMNRRALQPTHAHTARSMGAHPGTFRLFHHYPATRREQLEAADTVRTSALMSSLKGASTKPIESLVRVPSSPSLGVHQRNDHAAHYRRSPSCASCSRIAGPRVVAR